MKKIKVLNLYSGLGGNRQLWKNVDVIAIENNKEISKVYKCLFPKDKVIVKDAHQYLLEHYSKFDFIWSSPPCQTHSSFRQNICVRYRGTKPKYPDMKLYEEILFLKYNFKGKWIVENVKPYYKPLIEAKKLHRHLFWSNFIISDIDIKKEVIRKAQIPDLQKLHNLHLGKYDFPNKRQILRNCVNAELGLHILKCAFKNKHINPEKQEVER